MAAGWCSRSSSQHRTDTRVQVGGVLLHAWPHNVYSWRFRGPPVPLWQLASCEQTSPATLGNASPPAWSMEQARRSTEHDILHPIASFQAPVHSPPTPLLDIESTSHKRLKACKKMATCRTGSSHGSKPSFAIIAKIVFFSVDTSTFCPKRWSASVIRPAMTLLTSRSRRLLFLIMKTLSRLGLDPGPR